MRHRKSGRKLNRTASHRKALLRNLANQLIAHKEIKTTTEKAKEARSTVERLITYAKKGDLHHRRLAFAFLQNKESINTLFDEIGPAFADRQGGYTRVLKLGRREGDGAAVSLLQLVGFEKLTDTSKSEKKKRSKKKAKPETPATTETQDEEKPAKKAKDETESSKQSEEKATQPEKNAGKGKIESSAETDAESSKQSEEKAAQPEKNAEKGKIESPAETDAESSKQSEEKATQPEKNAEKGKIESSTEADTESQDKP